MPDLSGYQSLEKSGRTQLEGQNRQAGFGSSAVMGRIGGL